MENKLQDILSHYNGEEQAKIRQAFELAKEAHEGQNRLTGEPYITHPVEVALILSNLNLDASSIIAALLHDVPENTTVTLAEIEKKFGSEVTYLVNGVTRLAKVRLRGSHEPGYVENLRKMFVAAAQDLRVVLIKLADRLHNMRTLDALPKNKAQNIAEETLEIFAPLANRLGIGGIRGELEDLSFPYVYPDDYKKLMGKITSAFEERRIYVDRATKEIKKILDEGKIKILGIHGRVKHIYSLFIKLKKYKTEDPSQITDLVALRIIVPSTSDCYGALGLIHEKFKPLTGRIKDYISVPKPNGYQSLHTTVFGPEGKVLEIQIRTPEMHEYAERGIAAHWAYTESGKKGHFMPGQKHAWIKQLHELQGALQTDPKEFLKQLKLDFFQHRIFCFTPKGDVIDLPSGSTPIDFAFSVHSDLGYHCHGAKINGKMVKISEKLSNGDVVEIITTKNPVKMSRDWLHLVKTAKARERIRKALKH